MSYLSDLILNRWNSHPNLCAGVSCPQNENLTHYVRNCKVFIVVGVFSDKMLMQSSVPRGLAGCVADKAVRRGGDHTEQGRKW